MVILKPFANDYSLNSDITNIAI